MAVSLPPNRASYPNEQAYLQARQAWLAQQQQNQLPPTPVGAPRPLAATATGGGGGVTAQSAPGFKTDTTGTTVTTPTTPPTTTTPPPTGTTAPPPTTPVAPPTTTAPPTTPTTPTTPVKPPPVPTTIPPLRTGDYNMVGIDPNHPPPNIRNFDTRYQQGRDEYARMKDKWIRNEKIRREAWRQAHPATPPPPTGGGVTVAPPTTTAPPDVTPPTTGGGDTNTTPGDTTTTPPEFELDQDIKNKILGGYGKILGETEGGADRAYETAAGSLRERLSQQSRQARDRMVNEMVGRGIGASPALLGEQALGGINQAESQAYSQGLTDLEQQRSARQENALNRLNQGMSNLLGLSGQEMDMEKFGAQYGLDKDTASRLWKQLDLDRWRLQSDAGEREKDRQMQREIARISREGGSMDDLMRMLQLALSGGA